MKFNVQKCKVLYIGRANNKFEYLMDGVRLESVTNERDIGVLIDGSSKPSVHCAEAVRKASLVLGQITRIFLYHDRTTFLRLYVQFVRCHLELAVPA